MPEIVKKIQIGPIKIKFVCDPEINYGRIELKLGGKIIYKKTLNTSQELCEEQGVNGGKVISCSRINNNTIQFKIDLELATAHGSTGWVDMAVAIAILV